MLHLVSWKVDVSWPFIYSCPFIYIFIHQYGSAHFLWYISDTIHYFVPSNTSFLVCLMPFNHLSLTQTTVSSLSWWLLSTLLITSSSAVAKRPREASYLSVVSFNSTKRRVESFIVSYVGYRFVTAWSQMRCSVVFGVTLRLLVINISSSSLAINTTAYYRRCVSQLAVRWPFSTGDSVDNTWLIAALTAGTKARYRLRISISAYPTCIRRPR